MDAFDYMSRRVMDHLIATAYVLDQMNDSAFKAGGITAMEEFYCRITKGKFFDWEEFKAKDKGKHAPKDLEWRRETPAREEK